MNAVSGDIFMQRPARVSKISKNINFVMRLIALLLLMISAFPNSASCAVRADANVAPVHSCCAPSAPTCEKSVISNGCCCKAAPLDRAATPGLIAPSTTPFNAVATLPPTPLPTRYLAQSVVARDSDVSKAPPPKIYIFYRALLI